MQYHIVRTYRSAVFVMELPRLTAKRLALHQQQGDPAGMIGCLVTV
jgi:hypothetical protein